MFGQYYHIFPILESLAGIIVTSPTQPKLNSKDRFDTKMTSDHHHHYKLNVSNISADPILTEF